MIGNIGWVSPHRDEAACHQERMRRGAAEFEEAAVRADTHVKCIASVFVHLDTFVEKHFRKHFRRRRIAILQIEEVGEAFIRTMMVDGE